MDTEFQLAVVTKMLTFPLTISSILHQYSPYFMKPQGPITLEGLKSLSALRYTLYPENRVSSLRERPIRLFILNSKIESMLPGHVWKELTYLFPSITFEIHFIGSESYFDKDKKQFIQSNQPIIQRMDDTLTFIHHTSDFDKLHEAKDFFPYDPYLDVFFAFHPRFSHNSISNSNPLWLNSLPGLLESKCAIFFTGFTKLEMDLDMQFLQDNYGDECDLLMDPIQNVFNCTKWEFNDFNPMETFRFNELVAGFRGKRYHAVHQN
ncbi:hypothetical protein CANARDRAFT_30700 [[Candida] arabinofermentans NRRL YB-2248]|uniref:Mitochondrial splicing suppressor 51-like C-terminal domain-containing protein n=1 Tax=[Candida] arabinofermentans NRRL YB-2248 TaxID=983967 RepID=A0A1E4SSX2_9ASCO|nr:hypothetical protein CANARDRAFT_30700 [[Candida] arabinofermentans NRRL YB-2248]